MTDTGIIGLLLIFVNVVVSYKGLNDDRFFENYKFEVNKILLFKEYKRLIVSGFLHVSWMHLILNMLSLLAFSGGIEGYLGMFNFLLIYLGSLIGGNLICLLIHRNHGDYSAVGASGAVCGIMFASIALFPGMGVGFLGIPIFIPGWLYSLFFVVYSIYGIKSQKDNIGHEAHLGGALIGLIIAVIIKPAALLENYLTISIITLPSLIFIYLFVTRPQILLIDNYFFKKHKNYYSIDHQYNEDKNNQQREMDRLLDKINIKGINALSKKERETLEEYSKKSM